MYSPRIYENQIPCLYHAAQNLEVPMTQLANAFVYHGLISGYYGSLASELLPQPNQVVPVGVSPRMQIFHPNYHTIRDYMWNLPPVGTLNMNFQTMADLAGREIPQIILPAKREGKEDELVPF